MLVLACRTSMPETLTSTTPHAPNETFDCVARTLGELGYTTKDSRREDGFLVAEKKTRRGPSFISGVNTYDRITASALKTDHGTPETTLRLTATTVFEDLTFSGAAGQRNENEPSDDLRAQAASVLTRCAPEH